MKKRIIIILCFVLLFFIPKGQVLAQGELVKIQSLDMEGILQQDGSLLVTENIRYQVYGEISTLTHIIEKEGEADIAYDSFSLIEQRNGKDLVYKEVANPEEGAEEIFELKIGDENQQEIDIFIKNQEETIYDFTLTYTIDNIGAIYDDSGRLTHDFISKELPYPVEEWKIRISFDQPVPATAYLYEGDSEVADRYASQEEPLSMSGQGINPGMGLKVDIYFPLEAIPNGNIYVPELAASYQDQAEESMQDELNNPEAARTWKIISVLIALALAIVSIFIARDANKRKTDKKHVSIQSYQPALIQTAVDRVITDRGLNATILDFVRRGILTLSSGNPETGEYIFDIGTYDSTLEDYEADLYHYFQDIGAGKQFSTLDLSREVRTNPDRVNSFLRDLNKKIHDLRLEHELVSNYNRYKIFFILAIIAIIATWFFTRKYGSLVSIIASVATSIFAIFIIGISVSSTPTASDFYEEGEEERKALIHGKGQGSFLKQACNALVLRVRDDQAMENLAGQKDSLILSFIKFLFTDQAEKLWFHSKKKTDTKDQDKVNDQDEAKNRKEKKDRKEKKEEEDV